MITNAQVSNYLREHARGQWQKYFEISELLEMHGLSGKFRILAEDYLPISVSRKELISNLGQHKTVWLDGLEAMSHALVFLSPAIPSCTAVHVNAVPEVAQVITKLQQRIAAGDFNEWDTELVIHAVGHMDPEPLAKAIPDDLDAAIVVAYEASQRYMEVLIQKLVIGGIIWFEASTLGGRPIIHPQSELARLNDWLSAQPNLEVSMGTDTIGYTLIRKVSA